MEIKLTPEQAAEFIEDKYIDVQLGDNLRFYLELDRDEAPCYFEVVQSEKNKTVRSYDIHCDGITLDKIDRFLAVNNMELNDLLNL